MGLLSNYTGFVSTQMSEWVIGPHLPDANELDEAIKQFGCMNAGSYGERRKEFNPISSDISNYLFDGIYSICSTRSRLSTVNGVIEVSLFNRYHSWDTVSNKCKDVLKTLGNALRDRLNYLEHTDSCEKVVEVWVETLKSYELDEYRMFEDYSGDVRYIVSQIDYAGILKLTRL